MFSHYTPRSPHRRAKLILHANGYGHLYLNTYVCPFVCLCIHHPQLFYSTVLTKYSQARQRTDWSPLEINEIPIKQDSAVSPCVCVYNIISSMSLVINHLQAGCYTLSHYITNYNSWEECLCCNNDPRGTPVIHSVSNKLQTCDLHCDQQEYNVIVVN